jgi:4'-phosphopantetheinyl transferase
MNSHLQLLESDIVQLSVSSLDQPKEPYEHVLSADEHERASRFVFDRHRHAYIVARGILRLILGRALQIPPQDVRFVYGCKGKPMLAAQSPIRFNLSHSGSVVVYALTARREIGIDVEHIRPVHDMDTLARYSFSSAENNVFVNLPESQRQEAFFNCWTRKEAYIKALGDGLSYSLQDFDVTLRPGEPAKLLRVTSKSEEIGRWSFYAFRPAENYVGALAVEGKADVQYCFI